MVEGKRREETKKSANLPNLARVPTLQSSEQDFAAHNVRDGECGTGVGQDAESGARGAIAKGNGDDICV